MIHRGARFIVLCFCCWPVFQAAALPPDFVRDIQPIFDRRCQECHRAKKQKGGFRLDDKAVAFHGGDSGKPAIVPGESAASGLVKHITSNDPEERMPPKGERLTTTEIKLVRA